jgi:hypothetical protein
MGAFNNPGNIEAGSSKWKGADGTYNNGRFVKFKTPEDGMRALVKTLKTYRDKHGKSNISSIINRWAPDSENNTQAYIDSVVQQTGIDSEQELTPEDYGKLAQAITVQENGDNSGYSFDQINNVANEVMGIGPSTPAGAETFAGTPTSTPTFQSAPSGTSGGDESNFFEPTNVVNQSKEQGMPTFASGGSLTGGVPRMGEQLGNDIGSFFNNQFNEIAEAHRTGGIPGVIGGGIGEIFKQGAAGAKGIFDLFTGDGQGFLDNAQFQQQQGEALRYGTLGQGQGNSQVAPVQPFNAQGGGAPSTAGSPSIFNPRNIQGPQSLSPEVAAGSPNVIQPAQLSVGGPLPSISHVGGGNQLPLPTIGSVGGGNGVSAQGILDQDPNAYFNNLTGQNLPASTGANVGGASQATGSGNYLDFINSEAANPNQVTTSLTQPGSGGSDGSFLGMSGFLDSTNADGTTTQGFGAPALGLLNSGLNAYLGFGALDLAQGQAGRQQEAHNFNMKARNQAFDNFNSLTQTANT